MIVVVVVVVVVVGAHCCSGAEKLQTWEEWAEVGGKVMSIKGFNEYSRAGKIELLFNVHNFVSIGQNTQKVMERILCFF